MWSWVVFHFVFHRHRPWWARLSFATRHQQSAIAYLEWPKRLRRISSHGSISRHQLGTSTSLPKNRKFKDSKAVNLPWINMQEPMPTSCCSLQLGMITMVVANNDVFSCLSIKNTSRYLMIIASSQSYTWFPTPNDCFQCLMLLACNKGQDSTHVSCMNRVSTNHFSILCVQHCCTCSCIEEMTRLPICTILEDRVC